MSRPEEVLRRAALRGQLSHAYLWEGPAGPERLERARKAAAAILCEKGTGCGQCASCRAAAGHNHPDILEVTHEKDGLISVREIREQLVDDMGIRPYRSARKIYLVDEADKMNPQAQNALLKTLEEPPEYGLILLLTDNRNAFLPTVLSRCVTLSDSAENGPDEETEDVLCEKLRAALRRAPYLSAGEIAGLGTELKLRETGGARIRVWELLRLYWRDLLLERLGQTAGLEFPEERGSLRLLNEHLSDREAGRLWEAITEGERRTRANTSPELALEAFFLQLRAALRQENESDR
ncbi:MAG: hypothetical protein ILP12_02920 [Lachnospiraceae bacterium]|nr:hypothetical protein [Lachnospiraceae bacterium]